VNDVFLDTVGLLALWDVSDQWHQSAERAFSGIVAAHSRIFTTTFVLLECGNAAARRPYRKEVDQLREQLDRRGLLVRPTEDEWTSAWAAYRREECEGAGIVDHVSFVVMRRLGSTRAFTNDRHFRAAGFQTMF